jgi:hypothetical protein
MRPAKTGFPSRAQQWTRKGKGHIQQWTRGAEPLAPEGETDPWKGQSDLPAHHRSGGLDTTDNTRPTTSHLQEVWDRRSLCRTVSAMPPPRRRVTRSHPTPDPHGTRPNRAVANVPVHPAETAGSPLNPPGALPKERISNGSTPQPAPKSSTLIIKTDNTSGHPKRISDVWTSKTRRRGAFPPEEVPDDPEGTRTPTPDETPTTGKPEDGESGARPDHPCRPKVAELTRPVPTQPTSHPKMTGQGQIGSRPSPPCRPERRPG